MTRICTYIKAFFINPFILCAASSAHKNVDILKHSYYSLYLCHSDWSDKTIPLSNLLIMVTAATVTILHKTNRVASHKGGVKKYPLIEYTT